MSVEWNAATAAHLLRNAGYGASTKEIDRALKRGMDRTIEGLFKPDRRKDKLSKKTEGLADLGVWWIDRMIRTKSPLIEKLTLVWHDHFATAFTKVGDVYLMHQQNRTLRAGALGRFGDLVLNIARDPAMLWWLDNELNVASNPNENFARELMELFTTGVFDKTGAANYTERDVEAAARAFTGWTRDWDKNRKGRVFLFNEYEHDTGEKTFRGQTGNFGGEDIVAMLEVDPATARRVAWRLFNAFAYAVDLDDPVLDAYEQLYLSNDTRIRPLLEHLFRQDHFYGPEAVQTRVKGPVEFVAGAARTLNGKLSRRRTWEMFDRLRGMGQVPFDPPSVFGWDGHLAWVQTGGLLERANTAAWVASGRGKDAIVRYDPGKLLGNKKKWKKLSADDVLDRVLAALGPLEVTAATRTALRDYLVGEAVQANEPFVVTKDVVDRKVRGLVALALSTPEYQVA